MIWTWEVDDAYEDLFENVSEISTNFPDWNEENM